MNKYSNFSELKQSEVENRDYRIHLRFGRSAISVLAPHGGKIERGTLSIADAIAGTLHTFYCFEGIKPNLKNNRDLHISSNQFDEPKALSAVENAHWVITIHGARGEEPAVYAGGLDMKLRDDVLNSIASSGIIARDDPSPTRQGRGLTNICNRGISRRGLQLELTFGLRKLMFGELNKQGKRPPTERFESFVTAVRKALAGRSRAIY